MKALLSVTAGGPSTLAVGELPDPVPGPGQVVVAVRACAVNFPDTLIIEDKYQFRPERPFAPGAEVAGVIAAVGEGVSRWKAGDRVIGVGLWGGMAEKMLLSEQDVAALPDERGFEEGAALLFTYCTAIYALCSRGQIRAGDSLLVLGAAGGVGIAAVEIGKALGAHVVAAVSSPEKAELARAAGADAVIVYPAAGLDKDQSRALADQFKQAAGKHGFDIVYDPVGGDYAEPALRAIAWEGRYLVIGFPAGIPKIPLNLPLLKNCDIRGVFWGASRERDPEGNALLVERLFALWRDGLISPRVTATYALGDAPEAIARMAARTAVGKLVVTIDG